MLVLLAPAKTLDFTSPLPSLKHTTPCYLAQVQTLVGILRSYTPAQLARLMKVSGAIAALNYARYQGFSPDFTEENSRPALLAFKGDVYQGLDTAHYGPAEFEFAQKHVRILSGLYGVLRPLDRMQPYRLEMGTPLKTNTGKDLYEFWNEQITAGLNKDLKRSGEPTVINLASQEYFKSVHAAKLKGSLIHVSFKEKRGSGYKVLGLFAKRARGYMTDFIIREHIEKSAGLKDFKHDRYAYNATLSSENNWVFTR